MGSPEYYRGEFGADDQTLSGDWVYPAVAVLNTSLPPTGSGNLEP
jgi:hypothetical protein